MRPRASPNSPSEASLLLLSLFLFIVPVFAALDLNDLVKLGSFKRVSARLEEGDLVNARDSSGWTPLHNAVNLDNVDMVRLLIKYNADINAKDSYHGYTPLHLAARNGLLQTTDVLLGAHAFVDSTDVREQTPLHNAAWNRQNGAAYALLKAGANVNAQDIHGSTPTHLATLQNFVDGVTLLLSYCPDLRLKDRKGLTATYYAKKNKNEEILQAYKEHDSIPCSRQRINTVQRLVDPREHFSGGNCPEGVMDFPDPDLPYKWRLRETSPGVPLVITCPPGMNGTGTWTCGMDGKWERTPVLSQCRSILVRGWNEALYDESISAADIITSIASRLREVTLGPGDFVAIGDILDHLHEKHRNEILSISSRSMSLSLSKDFLSGTLETADSMLIHPGLWWGLPQDDRVLTSTRLQENVMKAAVLMATYQSSSSTDFALDTLNMRIVRQPSYYYDLDRRTFRHPIYNETSILLPQGFYEGYLDTMNQVKVVYISYDELNCAMNNVQCNPHDSKYRDDLPVINQVNSAIIGAKVGGVSTWRAELGKYVEVRLQHIYTGDIYLLGPPTCVWWDVQFNTWAKDGCQLVETNDFFSVCHCNHLTNLAVIMDIQGKLDDTNVMYYVLQCVTIVGCVVSVISLALCILCFLIFKDLREKSSSLVHANLCASLMIAELVLLGGLDATEDTVACKVVAVLLHYFFLATFTWSAIEAFHLYLSFVKIFKTQDPPMKYYLCIGYLSPLVYVSLVLALTRTEGYGSREACWLAPKSVIWTFAGPLAFIMLLNAAAFFMTMRVAWHENTLASKDMAHITSSRNNSNNSTSSRSSNSQKHQRKNISPMKKVCSSLAVALMLCLTWLTGFFYFVEETYVMATIFTCLNSMQGVLIFVFHIAINTPVMQEVKRLLK